MGLCASSEALPPSFQPELALQQPAAVGAPSSPKKEHSAIEEHPVAADDVKAAATIEPAPLVRASFDVHDVQPFSRPSPTADSKDCIFFLCHRGPDTKESLVRPLSFMLDKLGLPHFFDQSDKAMELGKVNSETISRAVWSCRVGVVMLSDKFGESKWCLRELNTFLQRRLTEPPSQFLLLPVYCNSYLLEKDQTYFSAMKLISSVVRKSEQANHEFLVSLVSRLLNITEIQHLACVKAVQTKVVDDQFLLYDLWNQYAQHAVGDIEHKKFTNPNPAQPDLERIKALFKSLTPADIKAGLEVYQSLEYSLTPPMAGAEVARYSLESVMMDLLEHKLASLGANESSNEQQVSVPLRRNISVGASFIAPSEPFQVLLIQGTAGSGKSLFGWQLCNRYHSSEATTKFPAMPLFVSLPLFRSVLFGADADPTQLLPLYFSKTFGVKKLEALQRQALVIVLDGLDELGSKINLFQKCDLHLWEQTIFLITCRSEFLQESDIPLFITPTNPIDGKPAYERLGKLYLLPFSSKQRSEYVEKFARRYEPIYGWRAEEYLLKLDHIPQLGAFLQEPLLLFMVLSVLPQFHLDFSTVADSEKLRRFDPYYLEVQRVSEIAWVFPQFRRAELYALFVTGWAQREINRLPPLPDRASPELAQVLDFCGRLAFEMFVKTQTSVMVERSSPQVALEASAAKSRAQRDKLKKQNYSPVDEWAAQLFADHQGERACSPLRRSGGGQYSFLHKSLQEYFTALYIAGELTERVLNQDGLWPPSNYDSLNNLSISKKRVTSDYAVLRFAAEMIDQRTRSSAHFKSASVMPQPFASSLFDILQVNRHCIAASNAITILNAAGVGFSGCDLRGLDLSSDITNDDSKHPQEYVTADLSAANFCRTNLSDTKLSRVRLESACLDDADLQGANLRNSVFGQSSILQGHTDVVATLVLSPDSSTLFSGSNDTTIIQWSVDSGSLTQKFCGHTGPVKSLVLVNSTLFSGSDDCTIRCWSVTTGSLLRIIEGHTKAVRTLTVAGDGSSLFSASCAVGVRGPSAGQIIRQWNVETGSLVRIFESSEYSDDVYSIVLSSDCKMLFSAIFTSIVQWSIESGTVMRRLGWHSRDIVALVLSLDDKTLFSGSRDNTIRMWATDSGTLLRTLESHRDCIRHLALSSDSQTLFSACLDNTVGQWSTSTGTLVRVLEGHTSAVYSLALSEHGKALFSGSQDNTIRQWFIDTGSLARVSEGHTGVIIWLALSEDGKSVLSAADRSIRRWCVATGTLIEVVTNSISCAAASPDGQIFCFSDDEDEERILQWSATTGSLVRVLEDPTDSISVRSLTFSPDNKMLFSLGFGSVICQWSVETGSLIAKHDHSGDVNCLALSLDGKFLFSGDSGGRIYKWSVENKSLLNVFEDHKGCVNCLLLSPDGNSLFSGSKDLNIHQRSVATGDIIRIFEGHVAWVMVLAFTFDGKTLVSRDDSNFIFKWSVTSGTRIFADVPASSYSLPSFSSGTSVNAVCFSRSLFCKDGSVLSVSSSGKNLIHRSSPDTGSVVLWISSPWVLSAQSCKLNSSTQIDHRTRLLLQQCGATDLSKL